MRTNNYPTKHAAPALCPAPVEMDHYLFDPPHCARINALPATRYFVVVFFPQLHQENAAMRSGKCVTNGQVKVMFTK